MTDKITYEDLLELRDLFDSKDMSSTFCVLPDGSRYKKKRFPTAPFERWVEDNE